MREILTAIAVLVIVVLGTAIIGPRFVNWNDQRARIETELTARLGVPVQIDGDIGILLLPTPTLTANGIKIRSPDGMASLSAAALSVFLAPQALLQGKVQITEMHLSDPDVLLDLRRAALDGQADIQVDLASLRSFGIERLLISNGSVRLADSGTSTPFMEGISATLVAPSLAGPIRGNGTFLQDGRTPTFRFSTGEFGTDKVNLDVLFEDAAAGLKLETQGEFRFVGSQEASARSFSGTSAASGTLQIDPSIGALGLPWRASARTTFANQRVDLGDLAVTIGQRPYELTLKGNAGYDIVSNSASANLSSRQIDIDQLLGEGTPRVISPGALVQKIQRAMLPVLAARGAVGAPSHPIDWKLALQAEAILLGSEQIKNAELGVHSTAGGFSVDQLKADLPAAARISFVSKPESSEGLGGGRIELSLPNLQRFQNWAQTPILNLGSINALDVKGLVAWDEMRLGITDAAISTNGMNWTGTLGWTPPDASTHPNGLIEVDMKAADIDLDRLPLNNLLTGSGASLPSLKLSLAVEKLRFQGASFGGVSLDAEQIGDRLSIGAMNIVDFGGATVTGKGEMTPVSDAIEAELKATDLKALSQVAQRIAPGPVSDWLVRTAPALAPAEAKISLTSSTDETSGERSRSLTIESDLASTKARISGLWRDAAGPGGSPSQPSSLGISIEGAEGATVLRQLGIGKLLANTGPAKLLLNLHGSIASGFDVESAIDGTIGRANMTGRLIFTSPSYPLSGKITLHAFDLGRLAAATGIDPGFLQAGRSAFLTGDIYGSLSKILVSNFKAELADTNFGGEVAFNLAKQGKIAGQIRVDSLDLSPVLAIPFGRWPTAKPGELWASTSFGPTDPPVLFGDLWIEAGSLDLAVGTAITDARFVLRFGDRLLNFERADARIAGGRVRGDVFLRRAEDAVQLASKLELTDLDVSRIGPIGTDARISGTFEGSAFGTSPSGLVTSLAGGGMMNVKNIILENLDPTALDRVARESMNTFNKEGGSALASKFEDELRRAALRVEEADVPISIAAGMLRFGPAKINQDNLQIEAFGSVDASRAQLEASLILTSSTKIENIDEKPQAAISWSGTPNSLRRRTDFGSFTAAVTDRAIALEQEETRAFEADMRERAMFNRRLKADRARIAAEKEAKLFAERNEAIRQQGERVRLHFERIRLEAEARRQRTDLLLEQDRESRRAKALSRDSAGNPADQPAPANQRRASARGLKPLDLVPDTAEPISLMPPAR